MSNKSQDAESKQPDSSFIQLDDAKQKGAASAASVPRRKTLVGALTAVCVVGRDRSQRGAAGLQGHGLR